MNRMFGKNLVNKQKISFSGIFCLFFIVVSAAIAQSKAPATNQTNKPPQKIFLLHADSIMIQQDILPDVQILKGNVAFKHDSSYMYCDSAYLYTKTNSIEAFDNVRIEQGDSIFIYGDYLHYDGNLALAKMRENVRMENKDSVTLFTDNLDYDRNKSVGYFFDGGMIVDPENELTSIYGQYSTTTKIAFFKQKVQLKNPQFTLTSDTLEYNTTTRIATITTPSVIQSDSGTIYTNLGWYNTIKNESMLYNRSVVVSNDKTKNITADSIFYNRTSEVGEAFGNMVLKDTLKKTVLTGNYGYFENKRDYAFATDSAQFIEYSKKDSSFIHGDTLKVETVGEKRREVRAYRGVRIFRADLQGVCDSLLYVPSDSVLHLYQDPIVWNTNRQMLADTIHVFLNDSTIRNIRMINHVFCSEHLDSTYYNQLAGRELTALFTNGELSNIYVAGNVETLYYPLDNGAYIGLNKIISSFLDAQIVNRQPARAVFRPTPQAKTYPIPQLTPEIKFLPNFKDFEDIRPKNPLDIFRNDAIKQTSAPTPTKRELIKPL